MSPRAITAREQVLLGVRGREVFLFGQPRPVATLAAEGKDWSPEDLAQALGARLAGQKVVLSGVSGRALAEIEVTDDISAFHLPGGSVAQVAAYTEHWHEFSRKILLRMKSWENYIFLEGH